jgi:hypothetical protein
LLRVLVDNRSDKVISRDVFEEIKPEHGKSGEHRALAWHWLLHHHVKGRDPVGGDDQQFVFNCINVPDLSPSEKFDTGDAGLSYYLNRAASAARI